LAVGSALGLAGGVMQALTRNPLADPGLLGINAGASAAVVSASAFLGVATFTGYVWFALAGAAVVSVLVYAVGGGSAATPARLALAGTAVNAALYSYVGAVELLDTDSLDRMRFWTVGSLADAQPATVARVAPFILAGLLLALALARPLNALTLATTRPRARRQSGPHPRRRHRGRDAAVRGGDGGLRPDRVRRPVDAAPGQAADRAGPAQTAALLRGARAGAAARRGRARPGARAPRRDPGGIVTAVVGGPFFLRVVTARPAARA